MAIENKVLTSSGFKGGEFTDRYGKTCSIAESSLAVVEGDPEGFCIWLGIQQAEIWKDLATGPGTSVKLDDTHSVFSRMHLSQRNVAELIPHLQYFVETGYLPSPEQLDAYMNYLDATGVQEIINDFFGAVSN